jgi:hypothetical protein
LSAIATGMSATVRVVNWPSIEASFPVWRYSTAKYAIAARIIASVRIKAHESAVTWLMKVSGSGAVSNRPNTRTPTAVAIANTAAATTIRSQRASMLPQPSTASLAARMVPVPLGHSSRLCAVCHGSRRQTTRRSGVPTFVCHGDRVTGDLSQSGLA